MASKKFVVDIDLNNKQLLNAVLQNLATDPSSTNEGQIYYNSAAKKPKYYDGTQWRVLGEGNQYTHPGFTARNVATSGANIIGSIEVNEEGHVISASTRTLSLEDLGYSPYSHPSFSGNDLGASLTGPKVISDVEVNAEGHVTGFATRDLTPSDIGAAIINDAVTNANSTWSGQKTANEIADALAGGMSFEGDYDAATNTPNLDTSPSGILKGNTYVVSVEGTFFSQEVKKGDMLIAKQNDPTTFAHWSYVDKQIPEIADATTAIKGLIQLATEAEAKAGTNATKAITPLTLKQVLDERLEKSANKFAANVGNGTDTSIAISHNLGTTDVTVMLKDAAGNEVICGVVTTDANTVTLKFNEAPSSNSYRVVIIG